MGPLLIQPSETPQLGVIAFHDAGASPEQFRQAFAAWRSVLPPTLFYAPRAPLPSDPALGGYEWYSLEGINESNRADRLADGVEMACGMLERFSAQFGLPPERIVAAGYSQGAVILLGLTVEEGNARFGQLLSFTGQPLPAEVAVAPSRPWPRIDLFHGEQDDVVPVSYANALFAWLGEHGANATLFVERDGEHRLEHGAISKAAEQLQIHFQG